MIAMAVCDQHRLELRVLVNQFGVEIREVPTTGPWPDGVLEGATLLHVETPSNPGLDVCDLRAAAAAYAEAASRATDVAERDHLVRQAACARAASGTSA